jgi:SET domain-containing protein
MMKKPKYLLIVFFVVVFISGISAVIYTQKSAHELPLLNINKDHEKKTVIKESRIPGAGNGLYAAVKIRKDETIGELGGRLVSDDDESQGNHYIASIPEYAWEKTHPYKYIDAKEHGGHVSRINFAPSEINGIQTDLQNAAIKQICDYPYFIFVALRDIEPGEEIWASYGPDYEYGHFMNIPEVRDFFCGLLQMDCRDQFTYSH